MQTSPIEFKGLPSNFPFAKLLWAHREKANYFSIKRGLKN